jgi:hypothetical protein
MSVVHTIIATVDPTLAPERSGQHWVNTSSGKTWLSVGTNVLSDWLEVNKGFIKLTVSHAALQVAALTNNTNLFLLPAKSVVESILLKTTTAFAGAGITDYDLTVGITGNESKYLPNFDADTAVAGNYYDLSSVATGADDFNATEQIKLFATSVGANLNASTAGSVDIYLKITTLP